MEILDQGVAQGVYLDRSKIILCRSGTMMTMRNKRFHLRYNCNREECQQETLILPNLKERIALENEMNPFIQDVVMIEDNSKRIY